MAKKKQEVIKQLKKIADGDAPKTPKPPAKVG
jgi:hypothetical protein